MSPKFPSILSADHCMSNTSISRTEFPLPVLCRAPLSDSDNPEDSEVGEGIVVEVGVGVGVVEVEEDVVAISAWILYHVKKRQ